MRTANTFPTSQSDCPSSSPKNSVACPKSINILLPWTSTPTSDTLSEATARSEVNEGSSEPMS